MEGKGKIYFALLLVVVLAFIIRMNPMLASSGSLPDPDTHFHLRMSEMIVREGSLPEYDELSNQGRYYSYPPLYHTIIAVLSIFSGLEARLIITLFPTLYGAVCVLLAFLFARRMFGGMAGLFAALSLAVMQLHIIRTCSFGRPDGLALLVVPAIIYLLFRRRFRPALFLCIAQVLLHPLSSFYLLTLMIALVVVMKVKGESIEAGKYLGLVAAAGAVFALWLLSQHYPLSLYLSSTSLSSAEMSQFSLLDIFIYLPFSWLFIIIGLIKMRKQAFLLVWFAYSLFFAVLGFRLALFLSMPAAVAAGYGIVWVGGKVKQYEKAFYVLLFLLASLAVLGSIYNDRGYVNSGEQSAMLWLRGNSPEGSTIASLWDRGHPLTYYTGRKVLVDGYFEFAPGLDERIDAMEEMISTGDCGKQREISDRFGINYMFIHTYALSSRGFNNGILEADCNFMDTVYDSEKARIIRYDANAGGGSAERGAG